MNEPGSNEDTDRLSGFLDSLADVPADEASPPVREDLVRSVAGVLADDPGSVGATDDLAPFAAALTPDLSDDTLRMATRALFACADGRAARLGPAVDPLAELVTYPDPTVRAWAAGTLGRLAGEHPDAVAGAVDGLRECLDGDDDAVTHNAVEALAALARERPGAVAEAAADLRGCLDHDEVAVQHNAAGVFAVLAPEHPDAVVPAVADLRGLCDHDEEAVRRVATGALARLATERPGSVADR